MHAYLLKRTLLIIPTFIGITLLVFFITRLVPGGPIENFITQMQFNNSNSSHDIISGNTLSESQIQQLKSYYGFDKPILTSYLTWLKKILHLDLGTSHRYNTPVWDTIKQRLPISIFYGIITLLLTYGICIPLGITKAIRHGSSMDTLTSILVFIGYAIPSYVISIILITIFAFHLDWFPLGGFVSDEFEDLSLTGKIKDIIHHCILPLIAYVAGSFSLLTFIMKNSLIENISADFMRTAIAKGCTFKRSIFHHALRNSLVPIATNIGENISFLITGAFLIETIFNIDGIGLLGFESLIHRDYPVTLGILVISSILYLIGNIISDLCVALVDPRIRFS